MKELREDRRPADLWFWSDWFSSFDVRSCSLAAQGLWVNMLGIMSRAEVKGTLTVNGKPLTSKDLAKIVSAFPDEVERLLIELEYYEVFSRLEDGTVINRRMYKASLLSKKRAEAGRLGGAKPKQNDETRESKREATLECVNEDDSFLTIKEEVLNLWNGLAAAHGLPAIKNIPAGSKRDKALRARVRDGGFDFRALVAEIEQSPFLLGKVKGKDFKATFDWVLAPSNHQKIIEGNYRGAQPLDGVKQWLKEQEEKDGRD
jgi:hypothetical protein